MLELLFRGFFEWIYGLILECWEYFSSVLFDLMSLDFAYLETYMPIITTIRQIMLGVGWALLLGNLVFQATRSMVAGIGFEADDPKLLFTRTFVFSFLLVASPQICDICLNMTSVIIDMVQMPDAAAIKLPDEGFFVDLTASWLLVIVFGLIVMFQTCKLFFEMAERYFILAVLTITAPLAFGVGGSRSTSDIFSGWCRMYGSGQPDHQGHLYPHRLSQHGAGRSYDRHRRDWRKDVQHPAEVGSGMGLAETYLAGVGHYQRHRRIYRLCCPAVSGTCHTGAVKYHIPQMGGVTDYA